MPTPALIRVVQGNVGSRKVYDFASHRTLGYLSWRAEGDLKTGGPPGPFLLHPYLLGTYSDSHNPKIAESAYLPLTIMISVGTREYLSMSCATAERKDEGADLREHCYSLSLSSRVLASFRSGVSKPSVNHL